MNKYDTIIILKPDLETHKYAEIEEAYKNLLETYSNKPIEVKCVGKKKLAYTTKTYNEGYYIMFTYHATASDVMKFDKTLASDTNVIKYLSVKYEAVKYEEDEDEDEDTQRSEDEQIDTEYIPCLMDILLQD